VRLENWWLGRPARATSQAADFRLKSWTVLLLAAGLLVFLTAVWGTTTAFGNEDSPLVKQSSAGEWTGEKKILAFYYPWYTLSRWGEVDETAHTVSKSLYYPVLGPYDSRDPQTIRQHMEWARAALIDGFIVSWWGISSFEDTVMPKLLDITDEYNISITVYYETNPEKTREERIRRGIEDFTYIIRKYGAHPAFLKLDGKPVIFVYSRAVSQVPLEEWATIIESTRAAVGEDFLIVAEDVTGTLGQNPMFAGTHIYSRPLPPDAEIIQREVEEARLRGKISTVTVTPGFEHYGFMGTIAPRQDGELYEKWWTIALKANPDWVLITSWNEWYEGTQIEPAIEYGEKYIEITRAFAEMFKSPAPRLQFSNTEVSEDHVKAHEEFIVSATFSNSGGLGLAEVSLYIDGNVVQTKEVRAESETGRVAFTARLYEPGVHTVRIENAAPKLVLVEPLPAKFVYSDLEVWVENGDLVATVQVQNVGSYPATEIVRLYINGEVVQTQELSLDPGAKVKLPFRHPISGSGSFEVSIGELSKSILVF